ncbi:lipoyl(octanoyl) transferase LipB [Buchnera aphidicola (Ceratoglyphina bambusae)]|uniref:lipoyl(octanoyl) transferase LipB n=1 Tax=Buchnera aphidicola TaxID=9 RepID=UPI0031B85BE8
MNNKKIKKVIIKDLGIKDWKQTYSLMKKFVSKNNKYKSDEIWFLEHYPVFTSGKNFFNKKKYYITKKIKFYNSNRGGGITYHGPGQQIVYFLINLKKIKNHIFFLINMIKKVVIKTLKCFCIESYYDKDNPGIYVKKKKICSIGLCIKNGYSMHGFSLNVNMDLFPFKLIIPCNNSKIKMTQIKELNKKISIKEVKKILKYKIKLFFKKNFFINY